MPIWVGIIALLAVAGLAILAGLWQHRKENLGELRTRDSDVRPSH